jgi:hypothetical protein
MTPEEKEQVREVRKQWIIDTKAKAQKIAKTLRAKVKGKRIAVDGTQVYIFFK